MPSFRRVLATAILPLRTYYFSSATLIHGSEDKLQTQLGPPRTSEIYQHPGRPRYLVDSVFFLDAQPGLLIKNITIIDHSESFFVKSPQHELHTTNHHTASEVLFGWDTSFRRDNYMGPRLPNIWSGLAFPFSCVLWPTRHLMLSRNLSCYLE